MATSSQRAYGRVAIITGGSRGIGGATVCSLAASGFAVVVNYARNQDVADSLVDSLLADRQVAVAVRADVTDELDVERLFVEAEEAFGGIDVLVHAITGFVRPGPIADVTAVEFDALSALNGRATFLVNREAARHLRRGGSIVNLTSSLVRRTVAGYGAHTSSRAATDVITRTLSVELADRDISVNALALDVDGSCQPIDAADAVALLVSDAGHHITGRVLSLWDPRLDLLRRRNGNAPH